MVKEGKRSRPRWALEESSFITNVCGQKHSGVERTREKKNNQARGSCQGGAAPREKVGGPVMGGQKPRLGLFSGAPAAEARQTSSAEAGQARIMDYGSWDGSERDAGVGTRWSDFGLAPDAKKPHNQRDAWWRLAAVFILICRIKCWIYEAVL